MNIQDKTKEELINELRELQLENDSLKDLKEKRAAELIESEEKFRNLFETMVQGVVYQNSDGIITSANPSAERLLGLSLEQMQGTKSIDPLWKTIHDDGTNFPGDEHPAMVALKTGKYVNNVIMGVYNPSVEEYRWINVNAVPKFYPGNDKPYQVYTTFEDITQNKKAEKELKESEERLKDIFEGVGDGIIHTDKKMNVLEVNEEFSKITNITKEELIGRNGFDLAKKFVSFKILPKVLKIIKDNLIGKRTKSFEIEFNNKILELRTQSATTRKGVTVIIRDITERKQADEALRVSENRVRTKLDAILLPEGNLDKLELEDILDVPVVRGLMENIFNLTGIAVALGDLNGKALVAFGWQDVCTQFHRSHPEACKNCTESDTFLASQVEEGTFKMYKCKNNMWDVASPIYVGDNHIGNLFIGQFFYDDEIPDIDLFKAQAKLYGFNEAEYLSALEKVPRVSREFVNALAMFYTQFSAMISNLSYSGIQFARMLNERDLGEQELIIAKEKAEESEKQFRTLVENIPGSTYRCLLDESWTMLYISNEVQNLTGYPKSDFIGENPERTFASLMHPDDIQPIWENTNKAINEKHSFINEYRVIDKSGSTHFVYARGQAVFNEKGIPIYIDGTIFDITDRKKAEEDLIKTKEKAEESDRLKSAFLANMSHEIRTPMNGILGFSSLLKKPGLKGEERQKYIQIIEKSGNRMLNIINDIVDISKIESGLMKVDLKESNINEQIEYIYTFFKTEVEAKGMKFSFKNTLPSKEVIIKTDREKVFAILTNLVKNAIKYTNKGSLEFGCSKKEDYIEFFVKDTGIGIPKDRQEVIFERFIQADIEDKKALQGAGLGLSISKAYVEMLSGKIWVESQEGKGSTFYFTIPYNKAFKKEIDFENIDVGDGSLNLNLKILIAEDDETSSQFLTIMVDEYAKEIINVINGTETVEVCRNNPDIDLILMDIQMPDLNGYEATRQIREFNKEVVIIAQTAYGLSGDREKALDAGCNDYISKPINKNEFDALIQKYFNK